MLKRLLFGLLKGLVIGGAVGAGLMFGLHWITTSGLLAYLIVMGTTGTAAVIAGKPPWKNEAMIEAVLKALAGVGVGALLYWLGDSFAALRLPLSIGPIAEGTPWTDVPLLYAPLAAGLMGAIVELDNTDDEDDKKSAVKKNKAAPAKARIAVDDLEDEEIALAKKNAQRKNR